MSSGPLTLEQAFNLALTHHQAGRWEQAGAIYREILTVVPEQPNTLHMFGVLEHQGGRSERGIALVSRAVALDPGNPAARSNLGEIYKALGRWEEAKRCHEQALACDPHYADGHNNLGTVFLHFEQIPEAYRCFERAVALRPNSPEARFNLGLAAGRLSRYDEAREQLEHALALRPDYPEAHNSLGAVLSAQGWIERACRQFERALALNPRYTQARANLGLALIAWQRFAEARTHLEQALALAPGDASLHGNLARVFQETGQVDAALASYRQALVLQPDNAALHSHLIFTLHLRSKADAAALRAECERWDHRHAAPLRAGLPPHANAPDPARRLRIGYVSPDFWDHPVSHFISPLLAAHDHARFEVHGYANGGRLDAVRDRLRGLADRWHEVAHLPDEALAAQIRADGIDILVDLTVHASNNRLLAFARQPAPVQVSWLGYAGTTGLKCIGYRFTDARMEPPGDAVWSSEEPVRLPDGWCCYEPWPESPPVGDLPARRADAAGAVTFGALNHFAKCNERVLRLWARLLAAIPRSRLLMYCPDPGSQRTVNTLLAQEGIDAGRVKYVVKVPKKDYLRLYADWIDLALDPFPYNGMTTTCDALWMGVPVVTLPGMLPVSRTGLSLLTTVGLTETVARDEEDYLRIAAGLANDLPRLAAIRAGLRGRMQSSALMDAPRFARHVEDACRVMWERWCQEAGH